MSLGTELRPVGRFERLLDDEVVEVGESEVEWSSHLLDDRPKGLPAG